MYCIGTCIAVDTILYSSIAKPKTDFKNTKTTNIINTMFIINSINFLITLGRKSITKSTATNSFLCTATLEPKATIYINKYLANSSVQEGVLGKNVLLIT